MPLVAPAGAYCAPTLDTIDHACGHKVRWHIFLEGRRLRSVIAIMNVANCPRCAGDLPLASGEAIYWPTGVAHCHEGPCGDDAPDVQRWLAGVGARIGNSLILLGG